MSYEKRLRIRGAFVFYTKKVALGSIAGATFKLTGSFAIYDRSG